MTKRKLKRVNVLLPVRIYDMLKEMRKKGEINSVSEFLRNIIIYALSFGGNPSQPRVKVKETIIKREITYEIKNNLFRDTRRGFGSYHGEILSQLKNAIKKRRNNTMDIRRYNLS